MIIGEWINRIFAFFTAQEYKSKAKKCRQFALELIDMDYNNGSAQEHIDDAKSSLRRATYEFENIIKNKDN